jgi:hypothetical protein
LFSRFCSQLIMAARIEHVVIMALFRVFGFPDC